MRDSSEVIAEMTALCGELGPDSENMAIALKIAGCIDRLAASLPVSGADANMLVPREPTLAMLEALSMALYDDLRLVSVRERYREAYAAMIAASPSGVGGDSE